MKKILYTITALSALLCACTNGVDEVIPTEPTATISIEVAPENRTYIDGENIYWSESGEQLNIIYVADDSTYRRQSATHADYSLVDNRATFTADITTTTGAATYTLGAYSPWKHDSTPSSIDIVVPQNQKSTAMTFLI